MLCTGMGYRDDREALIAERDGLRRDLEERTAELEALKATSEDKEGLEQEVARAPEVAAAGNAPSGPDVGASAPKPPKRSGGVVAIVIGSLAVGFAVSYYDATRERGGAVVRVRPSLQSCVPEDSRETFHVRAVISDAGVVTSAVVRSTSLGPLVEDTPASICVEAAVLGQTLPVLRDVTVMLPIYPTLPEDMVWGVAIAQMSRP